MVKKFLIFDPVDGKPPERWAEVAQESPVPTELGAVAVPYEQFGLDKLWDAASQTLRAPSIAERQDKEIEMLKRAKRKEIILAFDGDYEAVWSIDGEVIEAWRDRILATAPTNRTAAQNNKLTQAANLFDQLQAKLTELRNATTVSQINAVTWS